MSFVRLLCFNLKLAYSDTVLFFLHALDKVSRYCIYVDRPMKILDVQHTLIFGFIASFVFIDGNTNVGAKIV